MNKVVKDGLVAVLYSPGFGAGWYTWNTELGESILFDPGLVDLVLNLRPDDEIEAYCTLKWGSDDGAYFGGVPDLKVAWVPVGTKFRIDEYDGSESVITEDKDEWFIA